MRFSQYYIRLAYTIYGVIVLVFYRRIKAYLKGQTINSSFTSIISENVNIFTAGCLKLQSYNIITYTL